MAKKAHTYTEMMLKQINIQLRDTGKASEEAATKVEKSSERMAKSFKEHKDGTFTYENIFGKWHHKLTSVSENVKLLGFQAKTTRRVMFGFLPRGVFRKVNQFATVLNAADYSMRRIGAGAKDVNPALKATFKGLSFLTKRRPHKGSEEYATSQGFSSREQMLGAKKDMRKRDQKYFKRAKEEGSFAITEADIEVEAIKKGLKLKKQAQKEMFKLEKSMRKQIGKVGGSPVRRKKALERRMEGSSAYQNALERSGKSVGDLGAAQKALEKEIAYYDEYMNSSQQESKSKKLFYQLGKAAKGMVNMFKMVLKGAFFTFVYGTAALIALYLIFKKNGPAIIKAVKAAWQVIQIGFGIIQQAFGLIWEGAMDIWNGFFGDGDLGTIMLGLLKIIGGILWGLWGIIVVVLGGLFTFIGEFVRQIPIKIWEYFEGSASTVQKIFKTIVAVVAIITLVGFMISTAPIWVGILVSSAVLAIGLWLVDLISPFASGGVTTSGVALVGERGPELVSLPRNSRVHSNSNSRKMLSNGGGNTINITINARDTSDSELRRIADKIGNMVNNKINRSSSSRMLG